ncbi:MAG TPA: hypothetical protein VN493_18255 [Thermoanaerobaculia bacterium]|nr:hypothetical protein [Thermoanaerobaculia bacterium]
MSEYQYYEFQAIDRPLTKHEMGELRSCSSRATITATRFVNHYEWGSFKGDSSAWVEKYFDAFLYVANWGTHELTIRLPRKVLDLETAKQYCCDESAAARIKGDFVILEFLSEEEGGDWEDGSGWLSSLIPLRSDIIGGDHRALYLAWLLCAQTGALKDDAISPPIPAGLGDLTAPLQAFADFLRINGDLITTAAARSSRVDTSSPDREIERWIAALSEGAKTDWLVRFAGGKEPNLRAELMRRFRESRSSTPARSAEASITVGELLAAAQQLAEERSRKEAERAAAERARREREEAEARDRYLSNLAKREAKAWSRVDELIATKQPGRYDEAVKLLCDLQELGLRDGREGEVEAHLLGLREEHARKPTFIERLKKAGLVRG